MANIIIDGELILRETFSHPIFIPLQISESIHKCSNLDPVCEPLLYFYIKAPRRKTEKNEESESH